MKASQKCGGTNCRASQPKVAKVDKKKEKKRKKKKIVGQEAVETRLIRLSMANLTRKY